MKFFALLCLCLMVSCGRLTQTAFNETQVMTDKTITATQTDMVSAEDEGSSESLTAAENSESLNETLSEQNSNGDNSQSNETVGENSSDTDNQQRSHTFRGSGPADLLQVLPLVLVAAHRNKVGKKESGMEGDIGEYR